jgi:hypothetical protein
MSTTQLPAVDSAGRPRRRNDRQRSTRRWAHHSRVTWLIVFLLVVLADIPVTYTSVAAQVNAPAFVVLAMAVGLALSLTIAVTIAVIQLASWMADRYLPQIVLAVALLVCWAGALVAIWLFRVQTHGIAALSGLPGDQAGAPGDLALSTLFTLVLAVTGLIQAAETFAAYDPDVKAYRTLKRRLRWMRFRAYRLAVRRAYAEASLAMRADRSRAEQARIVTQVQAFKAVARELILGIGGSPDVTDAVRRER